METTKITCDICKKEIINIRHRLFEKQPPITISGSNYVDPLQEFYKYKDICGQCKDKIISFIKMIEVQSGDEIC